MMKILFIIIVFVCSILNGGDLENERNIDFSRENIGDEVVVQIVDDATEDLIEETSNDNNIEGIEEQKQEEKIQENISIIENTSQQYQEPVYVPETNIVQEQNVQEPIQETKENLEEQNIVVSPIEESLPVDIQPEKTEEYRYNAEMTQKMIDMINNNPNENMIAYGYEVVIDSSAKEMSNPFTYTDERMLTKIQRRCGTIHVYAEDYYLNGNYFGTDCYIY